MKTIVMLLLALSCFGSCSENKKVITFNRLPQTEFNATPFQLPVGIPGSLKQAHDSCMGFAFDVNALFLQTRDSFSIGCIVNRRTLKRVDSFQDMGISRNQLVSQFTVLSNPCYEERVLHFPLISLLGNTFRLSLPGTTAAVNKELNDVIAASGNAEMSTGSWVYLDMRGALRAILDTTQSQQGLLYKQNLLDTANMILMATESVTDVSFLITTSQNMSAPLLALLQTKPSVITPESQASLALSYITDNKFEMRLNGFFPVLGQFMKAELK